MNILILGAGLMQKPAILAAKELGYTAVVIDADKNAVSIPFADRFEQIDLKAKEEILEFSKKLQKDGGLKAVFTAGTDFSASVSYVCQALQLPSHSFAAAENASIKTKMRQCFLEKGVPSPKFKKVGNSEFKNPEELLSTILNEMDFPFVVKPVDNMGARGCRMVRSPAEFSNAVSAAISCSRTGFAIVEEYMDGPEYSIDALVQNGTFTVTGFAVRHIHYPPYFIEVGHTMPAVLDKTVHDQLISVFALGAKALGLTTGVAKADIKYTSKGPMIGEIAGRLSGGYMSGWTFPYASDLNLTKEALKIACGLPPEQAEKLRKPVDYTPSALCSNLPAPYNLYEVPSVRTSAERAWMSIPGTVKYIENIKEYTDQAVRNVLPRATVTIGGKVDFPRNNVQKCGNVISVSVDRNIAVEAAEDAVSNIFITLEPDNPETDRFLAGICDSDEDKFPPDAFGKLSEKAEEMLSGTIPAGKKTEDYIPEILKSKEYVEKKDWNYNTILQTVRKFDILRPDHPELSCKTFWNGIMRGGLQAAVYISDSRK